MIILLKLTHNVYIIDQIYFDTGFLIGQTGLSLTITFLSSLLFLVYFKSQLFMLMTLKFLRLYLTCFVNSNTSF